MKKSTLITTIAMIVVVVVALSTATYAWFSSSSTAVANVEFQTDASGDWSMIRGQIAKDGNDFTLTYAGSAQDNIDLTPTTVQSGLWCPTTAISTAITDAQASTTITNPVGFANAKKTGNNYVLDKLQTAAYDSSVPQQGVGYAYPFALRILNVSGQTKTLQLNVTLNAGPATDATNNSMYAAAAVRFYVYEYQNNDTHASYTSGYEFTNTAGLDALTAISGNITKDSTGTPKSSNLKAKTAYDSTEETYTETAVTLANYTLGDISTAFQTGPAGGIASKGILEGDKYLTYTFDMGNYDAGDYSNIIIYIWIDGWVANASAQSASFKVNFGFTSNAIVAAANGQTNGD